MVPVAANKNVFELKQLVLPLGINVAKHPDIIASDLVLFKVSELFRVQKQQSSLSLLC
jgi:hypothetical protein